MELGEETLFITSRDMSGTIISCYNDHHLLRAYLEPIMGTVGRVEHLTRTPSLQGHGFRLLRSPLNETIHIVLLFLYVC